MKHQILMVICFATVLYAQNFPQDPAELREPISHRQLTDFITGLAHHDAVEVTVAAKSTKNQPLYLIHFLSEQTDNKVRVLFYAQQHGNEPAGKDALLYLTRMITQGDYHLPQSVELWIIPQLNPDGAIKNQRRNCTDIDLNRDHFLLSQPETQMLHRIVQQIRPHVAVDCHEFTRDSRDYLEKGWLEWPLIMMGALNNPLFSQQVREMGKSWCEQVTEPMLSAGFNYTRYYVGGVPPDNEQRYSTPECDDARNGIGAYGGLSFIIESGMKRRSDNPDQDLGQRVQAYLHLFKQIIHLADQNRDVMQFLLEKNDSKPDPFIATNYFWANPGHHFKPIKVMDRESNRSKEILTANFMHQLVIKYSVPTPAGYVIISAASEKFKPLLDLHNIDYVQIEKQLHFDVEPCRLVRVESFRDSVYQRYAGRQIVKRRALINKVFDPGALIVNLDQEFYRKVILLLEPNMMYGLYQYDQFSILTDQSAIAPVYRIMKKE